MSNGALVIFASSLKILNDKLKYSYPYISSIFVTGQRLFVEMTFEFSTRLSAVSFQGNEGTASSVHKAVESF